jgi:hypothetical protein
MRNSAAITHTLAMGNILSTDQSILYLDANSGFDASRPITVFMVVTTRLGNAVTFKEVNPAPTITTVLSTNNMNSITSAILSGGQYQTNFKVSYAGNLAGWDKSGMNAIHVVDIANTVGQTNTPNYVIMFWQDNVITQTIPVSSSNTLNAIYTVNFKAGPAVYQDPGQATEANASNGIVFEVLRGNNTVLATNTYLPGAWAGYPTLTSSSFTYTGDGTGDIRLRIRTISTTTGRFGGCVDDVVISSSYPT